MKLATIVAAVAAQIWLLSSATAEVYPARPVRMVVATALGSGVDAIARLLAPGLSDAWNQPVVVDNRTAGGGTAGPALVSKATPDGYTLLAHSNALIISASLRSNL